MKYSKKNVHSKTRFIDVLNFEDQRLTSFSGLIVFQKLFELLHLKERLRNVFRHLKVNSIYGIHRVALLLVVHILLGYRELRDLRYYEDDPMVKRILGLKHLPDVATVSRTLANCDANSVDKLRALVKNINLERIEIQQYSRLTLDFDGSVLSTTRYAEGTAVGFNKKKKGARSYYPLYCTIAQTGQVFDVYHRPGNVHDSNGARQFILDCIKAIKEILPSVKIEVRMDSAFFNDEIVDELDQLGVDFSITVPFERFSELKTLIEGRKRWSRYNEEWSYFESQWRPKSWQYRYRFIFIRQRNKKQRKQPVQLDLFVPHEYGYDFKVIVTNKQIKVKKVLEFHNGRGAQESVFAELKSQSQMDYVPTRTLCGNQIYMLSAILAHNLSRELHMQTHAQDRNTTEKRSPLWEFPKIDTLRRNIVQRAGRITKPEGQVTLTMSANAEIKTQLLHMLDALGKAA